MKPNSLASLPESLSARAFVNGEDIAWEQKNCADAIDWLCRKGYAILGTELWLIEQDGIRTAIRTKSGPAIFVTNCDPVKGESWDVYVERSARHAAEKISLFRWPEDSLESPRPVYFNLCWADRNWFRIHKTNAEYFANER
jgi:hypothetical protein